MPIVAAKPGSVQVPAGKFLDLERMTGHSIISSLERLIHASSKSHQAPESMVQVDGMEGIFSVNNQDSKMEVNTLCFSCTLASSTAFCIILTKLVSDIG